ncbi:hypothetical protein ZYGR_0I00760 [Zygosaccharomyces rouxii]|uniref:ZYRO0C01892p n=2 Tax=Zygosaccharomyces rouxii TaxID=4956 RepID=C5DSP3_ZYGRC|nr:uncharacterized protein ZYRO0C01892g [Zygosaccharomyces rouxii]KAH9202006.1 hypothetical protein LQ764DRAFT_208741 [Zygosaccharomyces rouxii]GAV47780.1 hypothetical protein ZYGR_0I00760 [Zygosaccharomyces rouxii]CAR26804.1 ZYRO0C01892p [Zygosaccharomyces rouxii]
MSTENSGVVVGNDKLSERTEIQESIDTSNVRDNSSQQSQNPLNPTGTRMRSGSLIFKGQDLLQETKLLRDTLDLLWNHTSEQRKLCEQLKEENEYLQDYISNLMTSSNVLDK